MDSAISRNIEVDFSSGLVVLRDSNLLGASRLVLIGGGTGEVIFG